MRTITTMGAMAAVLMATMALGANPSSAPAAAAPTSAGPDTTQAAAQVDASDPGRLIQTAAAAMLKLLDANRAEYQKDPQKVYHLVDEVLLPHFDVTYAAKLVLGRHWPMATEEQRKRFVDAFYKSLLMNYGDSLADFTGDKLKVFPYTGNASAPTATIRTQVRKHDGTIASVNYSLHHTDMGWEVWDVVIEGISYVESFRDDYGEQIDQQGLDAVIHRLESGDVPAAIKSTTGKGTAGKGGS
jgi:phospholipid transport system substrate-binding protein